MVTSVRVSKGVAAQIVPPESKGDTSIEDESSIVQRVLVPLGLTQADKTTVYPNGAYAAPYPILEEEDDSG